MCPANPKHDVGTNSTRYGWKRCQPASVSERLIIPIQLISKPSENLITVPRQEFRSIPEFVFEAGSASPSLTLRVT